MGHEWAICGSRVAHEWAVGDGLLLRSDKTKTVSGQGPAFDQDLSKPWIL